MGLGIGGGVVGAVGCGVGAGAGGGGVALFNASSVFLSTVVWRGGVSGRGLILG